MIAKVKVRVVMVALLFGALTAACATVAPLEPDWEDPEPSSAPAWVNQPDSWAKLDQIENWLLGPGPAEFPELVPEAELQLAEGRLRFAETEGHTASESAVKRRLSSAQTGFRRVLAGYAVSSAQGERARAGLKRASELRHPAKSREASAGPRVRPRTSWGAGAPNRRNLRRHEGSWSRLTVHHSAKHTRDLGGSGAAEASDAIRGIQRFHMLDRHYGDIGYHFVVDPAGRVYEGRSLDYTGAHSYGTNNVRNIGICLLGDFDHERPSKAAMRSLVGLVDRLRKEHGIPKSELHGHMDFRATECPGSYLMDWVKGYSGR